MKRPLLAVLLAFGALPACALAQDELPALPDAAPAPLADAPGGVEKASTGTTVIGDQEAPIGLYIMPWRQSQAQDGLDRPARLLEEALLPLDPEVFRRQVEFHRVLSEHLARNGRGAP